MRVLTLLLLPILLAACGQAGDLYLPDQKPGEQAPHAPPSPNPDPSKKDK